MSSLRILHAVANMRHGGIQSWVMDLLRQADREQMQMDILTFAGGDSPYAAELERLGARLYVCEGYHNPLVLWQALRRINRENGPYDVIHAHNLFHNGQTLLMAKALGVPVRVSHSHNSAQGTKTGLKRRVYNKVMQGCIAESATHLLAVSDPAGEKLYGKRWKTDPRCRIVAAGVDFAPFAKPVPDRATLKASLGIPADAKVMGHVGRFFYQKNHSFLLEVAAAAMRKDANLYMVLVGAGDLLKPMQEKAAALGIADKVIFTGARNDVPALMLGAFDIFVLPSHFEGLGLVILEALAAGIPCVLSDTVPAAVDILPEAMQRLPLAAGADAWATAVLSRLETPVSLSREDMLATVRRSPFTVEASAKAMAGIYAGRE